jgi:hypothetical protein
VLPLVKNLCWCNVEARLDGILVVHVCRKQNTKVEAPNHVDINVLVIIRNAKPDLAFLVFRSWSFFYSAFHPKILNGALRITLQLLCIGGNNTSNDSSSSGAQKKIMKCAIFLLRRLRQSQLNNE